MSKEKKEEVLEEVSTGTDEALENENPGGGSSAEQESTDDSDEKVSLERHIEALNAEVADLKDQLLRKQADFENFRKRVIRDKEDSIKYANTNLLLDLVQIIDDFERAIKSSEESKDFAAFHAGIEMIEKQFVGTLERNWGLKRFESKGEEFDPEKHEAIAMAESDEHDVQTVLDDFQKGYMLHDRVLRHAKVRVSMPKAAGNSDHSGEAAEDTTKETH
ncbi:MAG: nucleotide exchange factor GrpE [Spirochaetales bacterium]|nr:nucleotide exchange factor GrpE [Spirochaetales bacterium]